MAGTKKKKPEEVVTAKPGGPGEASAGEGGGEGAPPVTAPTTVAPKVPATGGGAQAVTATPVIPAAPGAPVTAPLPVIAAPVIAPEASNPLNRSGIFDAQTMTPNQQAIQSNLEASAAAYRGATTPEQRAAAKQEYANMLAAKAGAAQEAGMQPFSASQAFGAPQRAVSPGEQARIANYNAWLERKNINPFEIGSASMTKAGGLDVPTLEEETKVMSTVNKAAETMQDLIAAERHARTAARGHRGDGDKDKAVAEAKLEKYRYGIESGAIDPNNPTAGMNTENMRRNARAAIRLGRDPSSLASLAQQRMDSARQKSKPKEEEAPAESSRRELALLTERNREANEREWLEEQRRRQQAMVGNLYANYY